MRIRKIEIMAAVATSVLLVSAVCINMNFWMLGGGQFLGLEPRDYGKALTTGVEGGGRKISEAIVASLKQGTFEGVVSRIEEETETFGGFVYSERFNFKDDLWSGEMVSKVPTVNASAFVFNVREIITENGKVISITVSITHTEEEVPYASIKTTMKEEPSQEIKFDLPSILGVALLILTESVLWIVRGVVVFVPLSFVALSVILLTTRFIIPIWSKTLRSMKTGKAENPTT